MKVDAKQNGDIKITLTVDDDEAYQAIEELNKDGEMNVDVKNVDDFIEQLEEALFKLEEGEMEKELEKEMLEEEMGDPMMQDPEAFAI